MTDKNHKPKVRDEIICMKSLLGFMVLNPDAGPTADVYSQVEDQVLGY